MRWRHARAAPADMRPRALPAADAAPAARLLLLALVFAGQCLVCARAFAETFTTTHASHWSQVVLQRGAAATQTPSGFTTTCSATTTSWYGPCSTLATLSPCASSSNSASSSTWSVPTLTPASPATYHVHTLNFRENRPKNVTEFGLKFYLTFHEYFSI